MLWDWIGISDNAIIENDIDDAVKVIKRKRCRYYNRGYKNKCHFVHSNKIYIIYLNNWVCNERTAVIDIQ